MARVSCLVAGLVLSISGGADAAEGQSLDAAMRKVMLDKHNELRGQEGSSDIPALIWDTALEDSSKLWASQCTGEHSSDDGFKFDACADGACGQAHGENLWMGDATIDDALMPQSVQDWYDEKPDWTYGTGKYKAEGSECKPEPAQCGHYTQVVSKRSLKVGCSYVTGCDGKWNSIIVCQYSPGGNLNGGDLFAKGTACSACGIGYNSCCGNLCVGAPAKPPTGKFSWQVQCEGDAVEYTLGACGAPPNPGVSWKSQIGTIELSPGNQWVMQVKTCDDDKCSVNCGYMAFQALDVCEPNLGFTNKFVYLGADKLPTAAGTLKNDCSAGGSDGTDGSAGGDDGVSPAPKAVSGGPRLAEHSVLVLAGLAGLVLSPF